jgi:formamidopyrimidine-DNA glycosylase
MRLLNLFREPTMPELPDVERFKGYLEATALHQEIAAVKVLDADLLESVSTRNFQSQLKGRSFELTSRHGKYLFVGSGTPPFLVMHFGMTGYLSYFRNDKEAPEHARVVFQFTGDFRLAYVCQRKLGLVTLTEDPASFIEARGLGPDALDDGLTLARFRDRLAGRRGALKSALMNQEILAGVGNVYADEILFQAKIDPNTKVDELDDRKLRAVYRTMRRVLRTSIRNNAEIDRLPKSYLLPHRDSDGRCPRCGGGLEKGRVSGRGTYYCPRCQK